MTTMEFGVNMTCGNCVAKTEDVLKTKAGNVRDVTVDLKAQRVVLTSSLPSEDVKALIETTGKRAVLLGVGARASAVAMLGGVIGAASVKGRPYFCATFGGRPGLF